MSGKVVERDKFAKYAIAIILLKNVLVYIVSAYGSLQLVNETQKRRNALDSKTSLVNTKSFLDAILRVTVTATAIIFSMDIDISVLKLESLQDYHRWKIE